MYVIGDVHGKVKEYKKIIDSFPKGSKSIQVGDFGFRKEHEWHLKNIDNRFHKINFGNHDDYSFICKNHSLKNYSFKRNVMTVRGAYSIDRYIRTEDVDWWRNEELSYVEMNEAIKEYSIKKPKIMITHDCPQSIRNHFFGIKEYSLTSIGLQEMFEINQPNIWIFGHHHLSRNEVINETKFICLKELEVFEIR